MMICQGRQNECGMVLVAMLALIVALASLYAVNHTRHTAARAASGTTHAALKQARLALLGYAASYPDLINAKFGPGYLPCPARDLRGISGPACAASSGSTFGRFPWHTLRTQEFRDGGGESLWYALSQSHRYNPKLEPLNNATEGGIEVDGEAIVAVLIAPGVPVDEQLLRKLRPADPAQFLEGSNADADYTQFSRSASEGTFNDQLAVITRGDLMSVVEVRVLGEVQQRLSDYAAAHAGNYPWLVPNLPREGQPGAGPRFTKQGFLAFHYFDAATTTTSVSFASHISLSWQLDNSTMTLDDETHLIPSLCLSRAPCVVSSAPLLAPELVGPADCYWWSPAPEYAPHLVARCDFEASIISPGGEFRYRVNFAVLDDDDIEIRGPSDSDIRTRRVHTNSPAAIATHSALHLEIDIRFTANDGRVAHAVVHPNTNTEGHFTVDQIHYAIDINRGEMPAWLIRNAWHKQIYAAWAPADCQRMATCLALQVRHRDAPGAMLTRLRAVALLAGKPLPRAPLRVPNADLAAWFEGSNRGLDGANNLFERAPPNSDFNDRIRVVEMLP